MLCVLDHYRRTAPYACSHVLYRHHNIIRGDKSRINQEVCHNFYTAFFLWLFQRDLKILNPDRPNKRSAGLCYNLSFSRHSAHLLLHYYVIRLMKLNKNKSGRRGKVVRVFCWCVVQNTIPTSWQSGGQASASDSLVLTMDVAVERLERELLLRCYCYLDQWGKCF